MRTTLTRLSLCVAMAASGCFGSSSDQDADGDGFPAESDCNDEDAAINPGAPELCNGIDDDCDDQVDEEAVDATTWYIDYDEDGYGSSAYSTDACLQPQGYVINTDDCDDSDVEAHPGADETCDEVDNDCDGSIDEDDAVDAPTWYIDYDEDGYGSVTYTAVQCQAPSGYVDNDLDCDDAATTINPEAAEVCDDVDNDCDGNTDEDDAADASTWYADRDGDGFGDSEDSLSSCDAPSNYIAEGGDCDDSDATAHPAAIEYCDGLDNNCDGSTDEDDAADASTWYADADSDGHGDAETSTSACYAPSGYLDQPGDCDDGDATINPGASELCDGLDNDCDGTTDEDDAIDASTWYADGDGDGYGQVSTSTTSCDAPSGYVGDASDCNDSDAAISPGASELCDGVDNDCDWATDEDDAIDASTWYADIDGDGYGNASSTTTSCSVPTGFAASDQDCDDGDSATNPGADERCDGADNDCDGSTDEDDAVDAGTWYADADMDGYGDTDVSATSCTAPSGYVSDGRDCDDTSASLSPAATEIPYDGIDQDCTGADLTDADVDGYDDLSVGGTDCDDTDALTHPGATELHDGLDNDCDGAVDDGVSTIDEDGDGYSVDYGDCDDTDATISPDAAEDASDGIDNDCDGDVDESHGGSSGSTYTTLVAGTDYDYSDGFQWPIGDGGEYTHASGDDGYYVYTEHLEYSSYCTSAVSADCVLHLGEDWNGESGGSSDCGDSVYAISNGVVTFAGDTGINAWGYMVVIRHDAPSSTSFTLPDGSTASYVYSLYGHLKHTTITVSVDDVVTAGDEIGEIGEGDQVGDACCETDSSGADTCSDGGTATPYYRNAAHLHFAIGTNASYDYAIGRGYLSYSGQDSSNWVDPSEFIGLNLEIEALDCTDADGDGYGVGPDCLGTDCDETSDRRYDTDYESIWSDSIDNDCDGQVDEFDVGPGSTWDIDDAISWASGMDLEVVLAPGTYTPSRSGTFSSSRTASFSGDDPETTIIDLSSAGCLFDMRGGQLSFSGLTIRNGSSCGTHGGVIEQEDGTLSFENCILEDNSAYWGGVVFQRDGTFEATTCTFEGNSATGQGGALYHYRGDADLMGVVFAENSAASDGGAVYVEEYSDFYASNIIFADNSSSNWGGGLAISSGGTVEHATFVGNSSTSTFGGGIKCQGDGVYVTHSIFYDHGSSYDAHICTNFQMEWSMWDQFYGGTWTDLGNNLWGHYGYAPTFTDYTSDGAYNDDLRLTSGSDGHDDGESGCYDSDGSACDMGAYGGPNSDLLP